MKKLLYIFTAFALLCSCSDRIDVVFDTPFVSITDENGSSTVMPIDAAKVDNLLTVLNVDLCISNHFFTEPVSIEYEVNAGNGLQEGRDFMIQPSTKSPLTFEPGTYRKYIRIIWLKNPEFDSEKDNTLTISLVSSSLPEMVIGYPGPNHLKSSFTFKKQ